jgi:hypothetical protein
MILPASYANGFAPRDGEPLYPQLWRGCVFAAAPCLGPTGLTLRDWSGFRNHGPLTSGTAANALAISGRHALRFNNTLDYVASLGTQDLSKPLTWFASFRTVSGFNQIGGQGDGASTGLYFTVDTAGGAYWYPVFNSPVGTITQGAWQTICGTWDGTTARLFIDAKQVSSTGSWGRTDSSSSLEIGRVIFGSPFYDGNGRMVSEFRRYNRALSQREIALLSLRSGIAFELAPRRRSSVQVAAFNRRRRLLVGAGS